MNSYLQNNINTLTIYLLGYTCFEIPTKEMFHKLIRGDRRAYAEEET